MASRKWQSIKRQIRHMDAHVNRGTMPTVAESWNRHRTVFAFSANVTRMLEMSELPVLNSELLKTTLPPTLMLIVRDRVYFVTQPPERSLTITDANTQQIAFVTMDREINTEVIEHETRMASFREVGRFYDAMQLDPQVAGLVAAHVAWLSLPGLPRQESNRRTTGTRSGLPRLVSVHREDEIPVTWAGPRGSRRVRSTVRRIKTENTGRTKSPHFRRGHWTHRWCGSEARGNRRLELRWIQPTWVGSGEAKLRILITSQ